MIRILPLLLMLFAATTLAAETFSHPALPDKRLPQGADLALLVVDADSGETVYSQRASQLQQPASLQKLVTALAAKLFLDDDYRFLTTVEESGEDIVFRFTGDPTFTRSHLRLLVEQLKHKHPVIEGNLYLNGGAFDGFDRAVGLPWDIMGVCYSAPSSSITLDGNCVYGKLDAIGENVANGLKASASSLIDISAGNITLRQGAAQPYDCELKLNARDDNQFHIGGCVESHRLPYNFHLAIQNMSMYTAKVLKEELDRAGIALMGQIVRHDSAGGTIIARHRSGPVSEMIDRMVKRSDNLIADNLLKTIGRLYYNQPGSFENGAGAIKAILKAEAGIDLSRAVINDGSGLSRNNRMSPEQIMEVVRYIFRHDVSGLIETLPVSGESGTLRYRASMNQPPLKGHIAAKTGSLYGTYNLAGRLQTRAGRSLLFVQIVSNYIPLEKRDGRRPVLLFEKTLYESLFNDL